MDWGKLADIADKVGGWIFATVIAAVMLTWLRAGDLVQGKLLDRSLNLNDKAVPAIEANTAALRELLTEVRELGNALARVERGLDALNARGREWRG